MDRRGHLVASLLGSLLPVLLSAADDRTAAGAELEVEVTRVIDGDTLRVLLDGEEETVRLLSVDTEEKIGGRPLAAASKPETVFGEETTIWAQELFASLSRNGEPPRVNLLFPGDASQRDLYGRLLCHVVLPDGRDYNLLLVELGKSPYFNKYGNSLLAHRELVRAQSVARSRRRGIWNPRTNRPRTRGRPAALRPYDDLLPWWNARAEAIDGFRARLADEDDPPVAATDAEGLRAAAARCARDTKLCVEVFGEVLQVVESEDGMLQVRFRGASKETAPRAEIPASHRTIRHDLMLRTATMERHQNFVYVVTRVERRAAEIVIVPDGPEAWRAAGPRTPRAVR